MRSSSGTGHIDTATPEAVDAASAGAVELQVHCFGHFEVIRQGQTVTDWRREKARKLLKHLIAHQGSIHRDVLLDLLWPELEADAAVRNLRVTLHALRRSMHGEAASRTGEPFVLTRGDTYELNPAVQVWVDATVFSALYEAANTLHRRARMDEWVRTYETAQSLYRDDYLIDDLYEKWTFVKREQLKDQYLLMLTRLALWAHETRDFESCIAYSHKILSKDPAREDAYANLMRCHTLMGRRARALRWYELCCETLRRDLNVSPSERTLELARRIAAGQISDLLEPTPDAERGGAFDQLRSDSRVA